MLEIPEGGSGGQESGLIEFFVPSPADWINSNRRIHPQVRAKLTRAWRQAGRDAGRALSPMSTPCRVIAYVTRSRAGRMDPGNWYPTAKAIVDGLTDAGLWPDDDHTHVIGPDMRHGGKGSPGVTIRLEPAAQTP